MPEALFRSFQGKIASNGTASILINTTGIINVEWDIYQISVSGPNPGTNPAIVNLLLNGFYLCNSFSAASDTATGPPDIVLTRSDTLTVAITGGNVGDTFTVGMWYQENIAGTSTAALPGVV